MHATGIKAHNDMLGKMSRATTTHARTQMSKKRKRERERKEKKKRKKE